MKPAAHRTTRARGGVYSPEQAAAVLDVPAERIERALEARMTSIFPRAFKGKDGSWRIPERDMQALVSGRPIERLLSSQAFAELLSVSYFTIRRAVAAGRIRAVWIEDLGVERIPESEYWRLSGRSGGAGGRTKAKAG